MGVLIPLQTLGYKKREENEIKNISIYAIYFTVFPTPALISTDGRLLGGPDGLSNSFKSVEGLFGKFKGSPRLVKSTEGRREN